MNEQNVHPEQEEPRDRDIDDLIFGEDYKKHSTK